MSESEGKQVQIVLFAVGTAILAYAVCFWLARSREVWQARHKVPEIDPQREVTLPETVPLISVIVPAHNEENAIRQCLESVFSQDYPRLEVILVDDRSSDSTVSEAMAASKGRVNFTLVSVNDLPPEWTGKCHALDTGVGHASGEWFAFLDADSRLHESALRQCYAKAVESRVNMLTLSPQFVLESFWEKALHPALTSVSLVIFPLDKINDPSSKVASANGMFYMISREAYYRIGGHREVKGLAVEDIGIGKRVKAAGLGLLFANGRRVMRTRMYNGLAETIQGWVRILGASINYALPVAVKYLILYTLISLPSIACALYLYVPVAMEWYPHTWFLLPLAVLLGTLFVTPRYFDLLGLPRYYALFMTMGQLSVIWVFLVIIKKIWRKEALQWRGTTYSYNRYEPTRLDPIS